MLGSNHRGLRDLVCDAIRTKIIDGEFPPGHRLIEDRLADAFNVSRNPVREALRALAAEGYVTLVPRRGAFVAALSSSTVEDIFELRTALEALAARLAARKADASQASQLYEIVGEAHRSIEAGELTRLPELNSRFHDLVLDIADNSELANVTVPLRDRVRWIFSRTVKGRAPNSLREHLLLVDAIMRGDEDEAAQLAMAHVRAALESYREALLEAESLPSESLVDVGVEESYRGQRRRRPDFG
ncbi:MAG: GntR family transcriptional regulator [Gammaproteobacteria bacterium]